MTIQSLVPQRTGGTRFFFFAGKGGVGKSTMSCATALWLAKNGQRTLLVTTDPAPNLSDIFRQEIGHRITSINGIENLFAIEIDPDVASKEYRERVIAPMRDILDERNLQTINDQLDSPCVEEVAAFDKFIEFMDDTNYDVVVFDTAPTGHTIRLLELPSGWSKELEKGHSTCIGPSASLQGAKSKYEKAISYLQDNEKTTFIFVLRPEDLSLRETKRSSEELAKLGIKTSLLIINGILPDEACTDEFFKRKKAAETKMIERIEDGFKNIQKIFYPLRDSEVLGSDLLESVADSLYDEGSRTFRVESFDKNEIAEPIPMKTRNDMDEISKLLIPSNGTRYVFFTGKGGVGKSTVATATSLFLEEKGFKTLILTTDPASHLQAIFRQNIEHEPTKIEGTSNLYGARIDQKKAIEEYRKRIMEAVKNLDGETKKSVEEDLNSPCAEEMAAFERFINYLDSTSYDIVVVDTAPTGHTLRLLELPSDWKGFLDLGALTKQTSNETSNRYAKVLDTMRDVEKSTFVFVMYPEYTPMIEAWRASEELKKQVGIETSMVAVNYLLPQDYGKNRFFDNRRKQQDMYLKEIKEKFKTPLIMVPLLADEPQGLNDLRRLGHNIFDGQDGD